MIKITILNLSHSGVEFELQSPTSQEKTFDKCRDKIDQFQYPKLNVDGDRLCGGVVQIVQNHQGGIQ